MDETDRKRIQDEHGDKKQAILPVSAQKSIHEQKQPGTITSTSQKETEFAQVESEQAEDP